MKDREVRTYESIEAWQAEGARRFCKKALDWKLKCPVCGEVFTIGDHFKLAGGLEPSPTECIGRVNGKGKSDFGSKGEGPGCDYACYGLFRLGDMVKITGDKDICVMPFA